ncbi:MAG TPA: tetratricopeptide repeat protein [Casimicrobiaceae bacterium]|nr:tetratricopeptide repeat protein [Casimicrobiaceae bacterium]
MNATGSSIVATVLFTDIEGSTRLWELESTRMADALASHDRLSRAAVESNHGTVEKSTGDGMLAVFASPLDALNAAIALQLAIADPESTGGLPLRVRCGLHMGLVERRDNDWFGTTVNRAARVMAAAHGGQVLLSQAVVELVRDTLPPDVALRDLGAVRLRDLTNPEHVHQALHPRLVQDFPALRSLETTPNNLPQQLTTFIGRDRERAEATRLLAGTRLLTIVGPGGIGKTRLSLQVTADAMDSYPDGVWFIELAPIVDASLVPKVAAQVLALAEDASTPSIQSVCGHLASRRLLLVLDNCEHLVDACARLADAVLRVAPGVRIIASSREPLNIAGEQTYMLPPLAVPGTGSRIEVAARSEAVQLFVERARLRQPAFALTERNAQAVAELCTRLDGIPLALELAAARVGVLPVDRIVERLGDRFRLLTGGSRTALPRQQTLRALIDWSYDLLGSREKRLFARLSVFASGWTLDAAEAVCSGPDIARDEVLDLLTGLVDKSLVVQDAQHERFRMLETLRDYARDRLLEFGDDEATRSRHCACFVTFAEGAEPHLEGGPEQPEWLARLDLEHENIRSGLAWSTARPDRAESALRMCGAVYRFWAHRGHAREGRRWCDQALDMRSGELPTTARAKALHASGTLAWRLGDIAAARSLLEQALEQSRLQQDSQREARILSNLGGVAIHQADSVAAQSFLQLAVALFREQENQTLEARSLNNLAALAINENRYADARAPLERALALSRSMGNPMEEANTMSHLGFIAQHDGNFPEAQALHEHALAIAREFGVREFEIEEVRHLGEIALAQGDVGKTRAYFRQALATSKEIGSPLEIALCLEANAALAVHLDEFAQAAKFLGASNALRDANGMPRSHDAQQLCDGTMSACGDALGSASAAAAIAGGESTAPDAAVADALAWLRQEELPEIGAADGG